MKLGPGQRHKLITKIRYKLPYFLRYNLTHDSLIASWIISTLTHYFKLGVHPWLNLKCLNYIESKFFISLFFAGFSLFIYFGPNQSASDGFQARLAGGLPEFSASAQIINPIYLQTSELPGKVFANYFLAILKIRPFENKLVCLLLKCIATLHK